MRRRVPHLLGLGLIAFFVVFPFAYTANDYLYVMHILITAFFYAILAASWSILAGYAGQFSFGHIGFMGVGAYTAALFSHYFWLSPEPTGLCTEYLFGDTWLVIVNPIGVTSTTLTQDCLRQAMEQWGDSVQVSRMPVWLGIGLGTVMGGVFGLLIGLLVLRLRAAYLALFTLGFAELLKATISAEIEVTRGQAGMELPALFENGVTVLGHTFSKTDNFPPYFVMFALLLVCLAILAWLASSRFGLFVRALREDQDAAAALGVNTTRYRVLVFVITTMMAAAAGAVQGHYVGIVTPNSLFLLQMSLVVAMAVIGGVESFVAAAIGANGVGKSTALKAAFGFLTPNSGDILLEGESLLDIPTHRRILKGLAYIPQQPGVFRDMSVEENLELGGWTFRRDRKQVRDKIEANYERFPVLKEIEKADCGRAVRRPAAHGRDRTYVDVGSEDAAGGRTDRGLVQDAVR